MTQSIVVLRERGEVNKQREAGSYKNEQKNNGTDR
jgi:hypothetical protein